MKHPFLIRLGGLAAMVGGTLYVSAKLLDLPDPLGPIYYCGLVPCRGRFYVSALLVGAMAAMLAIAVLYTPRRDHGGGTAAILTAVAAFFGLALVFW